MNVIVKESLTDYGGKIMQGMFLLCDSCSEVVECTDKLCKKCGNMINYYQDKGYRVFCNSCSSEIQKGDV